MKFKVIRKEDIPDLLDEIDSYNENERYRRSQFEKYLYSEKTIDDSRHSIFYGCFSDAGKCLALSYLNKVPSGFVLLAEIQCIVKGYGKELICNILKMRPTDIWLAADPEGGESLLEYYRQFGLEEYVLENSVWTGGQEFLFYRVSGEKRERFLDYLRTYDSPSKDVQQK